MLTSIKQQRDVGGYIPNLTSGIARTRAILLLTSGRPQLLANLDVAVADGRKLSGAANVRTAKELIGDRGAALRREAPSFTAECSATPSAGRLGTGHISLRMDVMTIAVLAATNGLAPVILAIEAVDLVHGGHKRRG